MTQKQCLALKAKIDVAQVFLVFMSLVGDIAKVSSAVDLEPEFVQWLADSEGWTAKIKRVSMMSKSDKPGDFERAINRALGFAQAQRMRLVIDAALKTATDMTPEELLEKVGAVDRGGRMRWSAKWYLDMASAIETVNRVSLVALGDTVTERVERDEAKSSDGITASSLHQSILNALNNPEMAKAAAGVLGEEQKQVLKQLANGVETVRETVKAESAEQVVPTTPSENLDQSSRDLNG